MNTDSRTAQGSSPVFGGKHGDIAGLYETVPTPVRFDERGRSVIVGSNEPLEIGKKRYTRAFRCNLTSEDIAAAAEPADELPVPSYGVPPSCVVRNELIEHIRRNSSVLDPALSTENVKQFTESSPLEDDYSDMPPLEDAPPLEDEGTWRRVMIISFESQYTMEEVD